MTHACLVLTTLDHPEKAHALARALVERQLAACVNIVPGVHSIYRWQGAVESANEWLLLIKTIPGHIESLLAAIRELHPYALPEFVVVPIEASTPEYLAWLTASVSIPTSDPQKE